MKKRSFLGMFIAAVICGFGLTTVSVAEKVKSEEKELEPLAATIAILPFRAKSMSVKDQGSQIADLLLVSLETDGRFCMVSRENLKKILDELQLSASGLVSKDSQNKIGQLTGAKILITGSVFKTSSKTYVIAKIIGVETSKVVGCSVKGKASGTDLAEELGEKVAKLLIAKSKKLLPTPLNQKDLISELKKKLGNVSGTKVYVKIEETVVNAVDPAAQTEIQTVLDKVGFKLVENRSAADFQIVGEAFGENGGKVGAFFSGVARAEIKVLNKKGELLMVDRQTEVVPALSINVACKSALQQAGLQLSKRILPRLKK